MGSVSRSVLSSGDDALSRPVPPAFGTIQTELRGDTEWNSAMRFAGLEIPVGVHIMSATLTVEIPVGASDDADLFLACGAVDNAPSPITQVPSSGFGATEARTAWVAPDLGDGLVTSPNFATSVQEVIDRPGWRQGNAILVATEFNPESEGVVFRWASFDHLTLPPPRLDVTFQNVRIRPFRHGLAHPRGTLADTRERR